MKEFISNHLYITHSLAKPLTINAIDVGTEERKIHNQKTATGKDSFFISEETKLEDRTKEIWKSKSQSTISGGIDENVHDHPNITLSGMPHGSGAQFNRKKLQSFGSYTDSINLVNSVIKMIDSINHLSQLLQEERSKAGALADENFALNLQNRELERIPAN